MIYSLYPGTFSEKLKTACKILIGIILFTLVGCSGSAGEKHVFILSGQSNMARLHPEESLLPILQEKFGEEQVAIAKYAMGTQPIRRWYRNWRPSTGDQPYASPELYDSLMLRVKQAIGHEPPGTITFIWMQGERDAREKHGSVYERSLHGLYEQLSTDLKRDDINFVIGRLNDFDLMNNKYPDWTRVREAQVHVGESHPRFSWVNTDDLNDGINRAGENISNDLHMSADGYRILGARFAQKAIELIETHRK